jgi:hypothetical protein
MPTRFLVSAHLFVGGACLLAAHLAWLGDVVSVGIEWPVLAGFVMGSGISIAVSGRGR